MAQEQAKSPVATSEGNREAQPSLDNSGKLTRAEENDSDQFSLLESGSALGEPRRPSLTERLRAEQRKMSELKRDTDHPTETDATTATDPAKPFSRARRAAGPAQRRITTAANDDAPSIGGLIFALQQKPSKTPFLIATIASVCWFVICVIFAWGSGAISDTTAGGPGAVFTNPPMVTTAVTILLPIALFWFLALLVWRAQELRLMASAMTEVAIRLAEPDRLAEQSVASLGQTIRRQVAAMNDAISRAIGRAGELEALVHNEVAALERSYGENELRVRGLISELASEREALANNSDRVSESLRGVGAQIARDLAEATGNFDKRLTERGQKLAEMLTTRSTEAAAQIEFAHQKIEDKMPVLLERIGVEHARLGEVIDGAATNLAALQTSIGERTTALDNTLATRIQALDTSLTEHARLLTNSIGDETAALEKLLTERIDTFTQGIGDGTMELDTLLKERLAAFAESVGHGATGLDRLMKDRIDMLSVTIAEGAQSLDKTLLTHSENFTVALTEQTSTLAQSLEQRTDAFATAIHQGAVALDTTLSERAQLITSSLEERLKSIDATFSEHTLEIDRVLAEHKSLVEGTFGRQAMQLNEMLAENAAVIRQTAEQAGAQSEEAVSVLVAQTQALRELSHGMLEQIHHLTQRFETQGQAILTAARALDSSNAKIDSILENRHQAIVGLLHAVNAKGQDLDTMMRSYAGMVEKAMTQVEARAKQIGTSVARDTTGQAQQALAQIERLREEAHTHTASAVGELKSSFETVIGQIGRQLEQMRTQFDSTVVGMREVAQKTAGDLDSVRQDMQRRMDGLPQQTAQATAAIRKVLSDQFREIESMAPSLPRHSNGNGSEHSYRQPQITHRPDAPAAGRGGWSGSEAGAGYKASSPAGHQDNAFSGSTGGFPTQAEAGAAAAGLRLDELARAMDHHTAAEVWQRFRAGERGVLGRHLYNVDGQATFDEISRRYNRDGDFRTTVDRYIADFERLLRDAEQTDPEGRVLQNYMTSETGRVYLLLAHASGRLR